MLKLSLVPVSTVVTGCLLLLAAAPANASHLRHGPTSGKHKQKKTASSASHTASNRPRAMDDARATEIQTALVKAGYLENASGHWDDASAAAMRKLQSDNGWQTKLIPDSRALIKLGLGPGGEATGGASAGGMTSNQKLHESGDVGESTGEQK